MAGDSSGEDHDERDTECGIGPCRRLRFLQKCANQTMYVLIYGMLGCVASSARIISVGNDVSSMFATMLLSYYAGKGHRPRWIAAGVYSGALYCFIKLLPHLLWGAGEDALALTVEHGGAPDADLTAEILLTQKRKTLCRAGLNDSLAGAECQLPGASSLDVGMAPALIFFFGNFVSGLGGSLTHTLGISYMDDNTKKSKTPFLVSVSYFLRMLGPALGYTLGSVFLKQYISPSLTPTITNSDPRWLGAWWAGWLIFGIALTVVGSLMGMFPRMLPKTVQRRQEAVRRATTDEEKRLAMAKDEKASFKDLKQTIGRLVSNKIFMCNTVAAIFYMFGFMPFWVFTPKYIEVQYHTTASRASFFTGSVGLVCSALGVLISGIVISRFKPRARYLAAWNVIVSLVSVSAMLTYPFLGCHQSDLQSSQMRLDVEQQCNVECHCDFVKYSPVCSEDGRTTFISACHAGCRDQLIENGKKIYTDCSCIANSELLDNNPSSVSSSIVGNESVHGAHLSPFYIPDSDSSKEYVTGGRASPGPCPVDCTSKFYAYIAIVCLLKFSGATGRTSNFLVSVRCVEERDKPTSMGFGMMLFNFFVFIPSPIIFGYVIDGTCLVWGKTCTGTGNCWQYDGESMRYLLNFSAAAFVLVGTLFDVGVWYHVKGLQIFDKDEVKDKRVGGEDEDVGRELMEVHRDQDKQRHLADDAITNGSVGAPK